MKVALTQAIEELKTSSKQFLQLFKHGTLTLEIYKPDKVDNQKPHLQDEVYIVISGSGDFISGDQKTSFKAGDFLFVPAGVEHRFVDFTDDFSTWVIFYGEIGGEGSR